MFGAFQTGLAIIIFSITGSITAESISYVKEVEEVKDCLEVGMFDDLNPIKNSYSRITPELLPEKTFLEKFIDRDGEYGGECVEFIQIEYKSYYTHPGFRGHASNIKPNSNIPEVGGAILTTEWSGVGHTSIAAEIDGDELILVESNYHLNKKIKVGRRINIRDPRIRGYFNFGEKYVDK